MVDLSHVSADDLRSALLEIETKTPTLRLVAALNYKHGYTQAEIATQYGVTRKTVYNWLSRIETRPLPEAVQDDDRPGRPSKLPPTARDRLARLLRESPARLGFDDEYWTPPLVQQFILETFDIKYSLSQVRRLMRDMELAPKTDYWEYSSL